MFNPTIKDVARQAGVSIATVSRVLNNKSTVAPDLAAKVNQAVEQLGYHPNSIARTLKSDSSKTIGFVVSDISNDFFTRMARGVEDVLNQHGYSLFVCSTDSTQLREEQCLSLLREKQVDGLIINTSGKNDELITQISHHVPIALFGRKISSAEFTGDFVDNDNFSGTQELTRHLIRLGHRKSVWSAVRCTFPLPGSVLPVSRAPCGKSVLPWMIHTLICTKAASTGSLPAPTAPSICMSGAPPP